MIYTHIVYLMSFSDTASGGVMLVALAEAEAVVFKSFFTMIGFAICRIVWTHSRRDANARLRLSRQS